MTYRIELSFDMRKTKNVTEMQAMVNNIATENACEMSFIDWEQSLVSWEAHRNYVKCFGL